MGMSFEMNDQRKCNSSANAARLVYRDVETNGAANINCRVGSVVLWFNPDWSSQSAGGSGPGDAGRFIELGSYGPTNSASTNDWWALLMSSDGNSLSFCTETNGALTTNVTQSISLDKQHLASNRAGLQLDRVGIVRGLPGGWLSDGLGHGGGLLAAQGGAGPGDLRGERRDRDAANAGRAGGLGNV